MFSPLSLLFLSCCLCSLLLAQYIFLHVRLLYPFSYACQFTHFTVLFLFFCLHSIHLPLRPSFCLSAHIYTIQTLFLYAFFFSVCAPIAIITKKKKKVNNNIHRYTQTTIQVLLVAMIPCSHYDWFPL